MDNALRIEDYEALKSAGIDVESCGNCDFIIVRCAKCACQYMYETESDSLFYDPDDLTQSFRDPGFGNPYPQACLKCGDQNWSIERISQIEREKVLGGRWGKLFKDNTKDKK